LDFRNSNDSSNFDDLTASINKEKAKDFKRKIAPQENSNDTSDLRDLSIPIEEIHRSTTSIKKHFSFSSVSHSPIKGVEKVNVSEDVNFSLELKNENAIDSNSMTMKKGFNGPLLSKHGDLHNDRSPWMLFDKENLEIMHDALGISFDMNPSVNGTPINSPPKKCATVTSSSVDSRSVNQSNEQLVHADTDEAKRIVTSKPGSPETSMSKSFPTIEISAPPDSDTFPKENKNNYTTDSSPNKSDHLRSSDFLSPMRQGARTSRSQSVGRLSRSRIQNRRRHKSSVRTRRAASTGGRRTNRSRSPRYEPIILRLNRSKGGSNRPR